MTVDTKEVSSSRDRTLEQRRSLVRRITSSSSFAKSPRLSALLTYVCDLTLEERSREINEQRIGEEVFGRSRDYDSTVDGIVRAQASRLRSRLDIYFKEEGSKEPIRIVIPRGGYVPHFEKHFADSPPIVSSVPTELAPLEAPNGIASANRSHKFMTRNLPWVLVTVLAALLVVLHLQKDRRTALSQRSKAEGHPLWSQLFGSDQTTLAVFGDSGLVMWHAVTGRALGLAEYTDGSYRAELSPIQDSRSNEAVDLANRRYTTVVDVEVLRALDRIAGKENGKLKLRYARDARINELKHGNIILLGATEANPWVGLFESHMNFVFASDQTHRVMSIVNKTPRLNEAPRWNQDFPHQVYAVVAYLPNLSGDGNALIVEGTSMAGTECAWDFVSDKNQLEPFLKVIRHRNGILPHFEVVLGTNNISGSGAKGSILAWRADK